MAASALRARPRAAVRCTCDRCDPPATPLTASAIGWRVLAGAAVGQLLVVVLDYAIGGPGPFVLFGL